MHVGISALHVRPKKSGSHEPYMVNLIRALSELETPHRFTIFVTPANQGLFAAAPPHFEFIVYPPLAEQVLPRIVCEQFVLPLEAVRRRIDVMHYGGTAGSFLIRRSDVVTIHHDSVTQRASMSRLRNFYFDLVLRLNRRAGHLIVPTQVYSEELATCYRYRPNQMCPIHHGTHPAFAPQPERAVKEARQRWSIEPGAILSVTNTLPHKNVSNLLRAFDLLHNRYRIAPQLVLVGNINTDVFGRLLNQETVDPAYLSSRVKIIPFMPNDQLPPVYGAAAVFAFVSLTETFGMPLTEAMACGVPIVASDIPVHREILQDAGLMVSPGDAEAIARALYTVLTDEVLRDRLRQAALVRGKVFTWHETACQTMRVYEQANRSVGEKG